MDREASSAVSDTVNYIRRRVGDVQSWLEKITGKHEVTQSASLIISKISSQLTAYAAAIPAAWHIGLCPSLATLAGAGVVGGWYGSLEDVLGRTLAIVALMALNGAVAGMCPIPMAISAVITQIVSFTVAGIAAARSPTYDPSGRRVSSPSRAWSLVFGSIAGFGLGNSVIAPLLAGGAGHQVIRTLSNSTSYPKATPVSGMLGKTGIAIIQVKHLYLILVRLRGGQCGLDMVAPVFASLLTASAMDLPTVVTGVTIVIGLLIVRSSLSYLKYAVGSTARGVRSTDGRNPYIEDYFNDFDELALNMLSAASIMANPASIISVLIAWMADGVRNGSLSSRGFQESYRVYAGVPLAITIISEGLRWARAFQGGEENHSALHSLLFSIPSAIAAVCGVVYYANQPGFVDAIKNVWNASVGFLTSVIRTLIDVTKKTIANGLTWIGDQIGMGLFRGIPFCGRSSENGSLEMTEMTLAIRPEPQIVNDWFHREWIRMSGLTLIQRMQYSRSLGVQESSGVVPPMSMQNYIKKTRQGVSCCWRARTDVPFDSIKITTADLASIVGHFSCGVSTQANSFSMKRNGFELTGEIGYNQSIGVFWFQGVTSISSFAVGLIFKPVSDALDIFVIGFRLPSALLKRVLGALSASHPVISNILGSRVDYDLDLLKQEIEGPLGLNRVGVDLSWNTTMTGVLLSGAALFAGGQFFESVLTMTTDSGAIPKTWLVQPDDFTRDEWSCTAYYILALYEAGAMSPVLMSPMRATELPLQIFGDNPVMWRTVTNWKSPVPAASNYRDMRGKTLVVKRDVRDADGSDVFLKGTSLGHITIDGNVSYKQQWIHAAYWCSISIIVRTVHGTEMSTLGGACHCNIEIDVPADEVTVNLCEVHRSYYTTSSTHGHPFKSSEYLRGKTSGDDISPKVNRLLTEWYRVTGRDKKMQGPKPDIEPKKIKQGLLSRLFSGLSGGQQDIEHSEILIDYFSRTIGDFVKDLFHKDNLAVQALCDLNKAHIARQFQEPAMETTTVEVFQDARGLDDYLIGWDRPNKAKKPRWPWFQEVHAWPFKDTEITCNDIQRISERNNSLASRMTKKEWERLKQVGRVILPKRVSEEAGAYVSRGGFKMQQLYEADPDFFNDCSVFCDPTSGYGGFAEYLSTAFEKSTPRLYLLSTLQEKGHRVLDPTVLGLRSNLRIVQMSEAGVVDKANIKDGRCRKRILENCTRYGLADMLLLDAGEYSGGLSENRAFWYNASSGTSFLNAVLDLLKCIKKGGRMVFKMNGIWCGCFDVLHSILRHFKGIKAIKLGTTHLGSPEFYIFARGFDQRKNESAKRTETFYNALLERTYDSYLESRRVIINRGRGRKPLERYDWFSPTIKSENIRVMVRPDNLPPGIKILASINDWQIDTEWDPQWDARIDKFKKLVSKRNLRWMDTVGMDVQHISPIGTIARKKKSAIHKNVKNGLISNALEHVWGINSSNSTFCHTQATDKWKNASIKKRLDVDPGHLDQASVAKLMRALLSLETEYAKTLHGKCGLMGKEDVLVAINYQGATGILDNGHTLRDYIENHSDWYEKSLDMITKWGRGETTDSYFTCRPKNEPKKKKCVTNGRMDFNRGVSSEELAEHNEQGHRFIQFADAKTRLAHYILLGDLIRKAHVKKTYKGTINGTPVMRQGNVLKALWERHGRQDKAMLSNLPYHQSGVALEVTYDEEEVAAICLDYSGWDSSVTPEERLIAASFHCRSYPKELHTAIMNCCLEQCYPIVTADDGETWVRSGQRGSGELLTSYENTELVAANTLVAISDATGIPIEELARTTGKLHYRTKEGVEREDKTIELMRLSQLSDGDDTVIIGPANLVNMIAKNLEEPLTRLKKSVRSSTGSGVKYTENFEEVEFCSHTYDQVLIGVKDSKVVARKDLMEYLNQNRLSQVWYLPSRPVPDILGKMRLTLKINTNVWDPQNDQCVEITRSKILSYLLLYPHIRPIRHAALALLTVTGDGSMESSELFKRYDWPSDIKKTTGEQALSSIYGVTRLDNIGYRQFGALRLGWILYGVGWPRGFYFLTAHSPWKPRWN